MDNNEMIFDEWHKTLAEFCEGLNHDVTEEYEEDGNPSGAGRYGFIRSSEDCEALIRGKNAEFRPESNRWFEHIYCGYACWRDGQAELEYDDIEREEFHKEHPQIHYKEAFYDFQYGDTWDSVATASFWLEEREGPMYREFHFNVKDITRKQLDECFTAIENWQCTGELILWHFSTFPCTGPWRKHQ